MASTKTKVKGFVAGAMLVPVFGVATHLFMGFASGHYDDFTLPTDKEYSLKYRFENAYTFNVPEEHQKYIKWVRRYPGDNIVAQPTDYMGAPYVAYPAMLLFGLMGARYAGTREIMKRRRWQNQYRR